MAMPVLDKEYEDTKTEAKKLIAAGGCAAIKFWSYTDALRLCPGEHRKEIKFEPMEGMVYISEWLDAAKKAIKLINKGVELIEPKDSPPLTSETDQPVQEEVKPFPLINKITAVLNQRLEAFGDRDNGIRIFGRIEAAYDIEKIVQDQIGALQSRLSQVITACQPIKDDFLVGHILKLAEGKEGKV